MDSNKKLAFTYIARVRRSLRLLAHRHSALHDERRLLERSARLLKDKGNPFDAARIETMEAAARDVAGRARAVREHIHEFGKLLADASRLIDVDTSLSERCDILNVNVADRGDLTEAAGILQIVAVYGLEDSAERRDAEWKDGPLFNALNSVFMDFLTNTPEGRKVGNSLFEPGGMLADLPSYRMNAAGTMTRNPPRLRVVGELSDAG